MEERSRLPLSEYLADNAGPGSSDFTPEKRLLVAIIRRAIWDFVLYRDEDPKQYEDGDERDRCRARLDLAEDAAGWLFWDGEETVDEGGRWTFRFICSTLELDHKRVRHGILRMTRDHIKHLNSSFGD